MMLNDDLNLLIQALDQFISGGDRSVVSARRIEEQMLEIFSEDEEFEEALHYLSLYQPGGGEYLYDMRAILPVLKFARAQAERRRSSSS